VLESFFVGRPSPFLTFFSKYAHYLITKFLPRNTSYTIEFNLYQSYDKRVCYSQSKQNHELAKINTKKHDHNETHEKNRHERSEEPRAF
jgi:hypothetical protein